MKDKYNVIAAIVLAAGLMTANVCAAEDPEESIRALQEKIEVLESEKEVLESEKEVLESEKKDMETKFLNYQITIQKLQNDVSEKNQLLETLAQTAETDRASAAPAPEATVAAAPAASTGAGVDVTTLEAGQILSESQIDRNNLDSCFVANPIPDTVWSRMYGRSFQDNYDIQREDLRYVKLLHVNFNGEIQVGELVVNARIADIICQIFKELFVNNYQIKSMYLIDNYWTGDGDSSDYASIDVDNTSAFCYRHATGSSTLSKHGLGYAIDLNPLENPYVTYYGDGSTRNAHSNATAYVNRDPSMPHVITESDLAYQLFTQNGFDWGGNWDNPKDFQHFQYLY